jgi:sugar phosphate isomerase/epimerase
MKWFPTLPSLTLMIAVCAQAANPIPADVRTNGFALGSQSYTFRLFTFEEACEKTAAAGLHTTELFPSQKISAAFPNEKTGPGVSAEGLAAIKEILKKHQIQPVAIGVIGIPTDEEGARKVFAFAKELGIGVINTESTNAIDMIEKMVKEFDIKVGYHNHPRRPNDENYKVWDPNYILELTKGRDARIGSCADMGHWTNSGLSAAESIRLLKGRVVSSHIKEIAKGGTAVVPAGTGRANLPEALKALKEVGFEGPISIEHEANWDNNLEDVKGYVELVKAQAK